MAASAVRPAKTEYDTYYERYISLVPDEDVLVTLDLQLSETLILLRRAFGWSRLSYVRVNVSPHKTKTEVTPAVVAEIERLNRQDIELHRWAIERFDRAIATDPSFADELERFRRHNARYRPFGMLRHGVPTRMRKWLARTTGSSAARDLTVRP